jgi:hypothetical protein
MESLDSTVKCMHGSRQQLFGARKNGTPKAKGEGEHKIWYTDQCWNQTCRPSPNDMICASLLHYWAR